MRKLMFVLSIVVAATIFGGCSDNYHAPKSMRDTCNNQYPKAVDVEWEKKRGFVVVEFHLPGVSSDCEAWYTKSGKWLMTKFDMSYTDLPIAVRNAFEGEYGADTPVDEVERLERNNGDTIYFIEATVVINGYLTDIYLDYSEDGTLLRTAVDVENYDNVYYYL